MRKKLLFLTPFGRTNEPEDARWMHLYFSSLKEHVIPFYDTKVVLLCNYKLDEGVLSDQSMTYQQIKDYGLEDVVILKTIYEMNLSDKAIKFLHDLGVYISVGAKKNLLFDYARQNKFFDADWIFSTDSDIEFQSNFNEILSAIDNIPFSTKLITIAGDVSYTYITKKNNNYVHSYLIEQADRVYLYNDDTIPNEAYTATKKKVTLTKSHVVNESSTPGNSDEYADVIYVSPPTTKVRPDFVGFSRWFADSKPDVNWVNESFMLGPRGMQVSGESLTDDDKSLLSDWFSSPNNVDLTFGGDKGSTFEFELKKGSYFTFRIDLPPMAYMIYHYGGGWGTYATTEDKEQHKSAFFEATRTNLPKHYSKYKSIWVNDWPDLG